VDLHDERIARHRAIDVERSGLGIAAGRALIALRVVPASVDRGRDDRIADADVHDRRILR
jgi:hypothetical protein